MSASTDRPSFRDVLEASAFYYRAAVEREGERTGEEQIVTDVPEAESDPIRRAIETAVRSRDRRSDALPDGLAETVERVDFFTGVADGTPVHVGLTPCRLRPGYPPAVEFGVRIVDDAVSPERPGAIELEVANAGSTALEVFSGTVPPFGPVYAETVDGGEGFLLWRDYEEGCITIDDGGPV